jgi:ribosomal protein S18 acetylase RimI-like enzyme
MKAEAHKYQIAVARWPEDTEIARALLTNYGESLAAAGVRVLRYEEELRGLPGKYAEKKAELLLAQVGGEAAGCVAITERVLADGTCAGEMKRLWVEPRFRGLGLGRGLVYAAIDWAQSQGWGAVVLDTVNEAMPKAAALYRSLGFDETGRFNDNPVPGLTFYILKLSGGTAEKNDH